MMMLRTPSNGSSLHIPGWVLTVVGISIGLILFGVKLSDTRRDDIEYAMTRDVELGRGFSIEIQRLTDSLERISDHARINNYRLCRIERYLNLEPNHLCYDTYGNMTPGTQGAR
jgi:hypothetical protein